MLKLGLCVPPSHQDVLLNLTLTSSGLPQGSENLPFEETHKPFFLHPTLKSPAPAAQHLPRCCRGSPAWSFLPVGGGCWLDLDATAPFRAAENSSSRSRVTSMELFQHPAYQPLFPLAAGSKEALIR